MKFYIFLIWGWFSAVCSMEVKYFPPMTLGRSYDVNTDNIGSEVFPPSETTSDNNINVIPFESVKIDTRIIKSAQDARNLLSVSGKMSLKLQMGLLDIKGYGSYLKESTNKENSIDVVVKVRYQTQVKTLTSNIQPYPRWYDRQNVVGKHYVRSLIYGSELIAQMKFVTTDSSNKEDIQAVLSAGISLGGGGILDAKVEGHFKRAMRFASSRSNMYIKIFSTEEMNEYPKDVDAFLRIIQNFPNKVKSRGDGKGQPISAELAKLSLLEKNRNTFQFAYTKDRYLLTRLDLLEEMYDDLMATNIAIDDWLKDKTCNVPDAVLQELGQLAHDIIIVNRAMVNFMTAYSSNAADRDEIERKIEEVKTIYYGSSNHIPVKFIRRFKTIIGEEPKSPLATELKGLCNLLVTAVSGYSIEQTTFMNMIQLLLDIKEVETIDVLLRLGIYLSQIFDTDKDFDHEASIMVLNQPRTGTLNFEPYCPLLGSSCRNMAFLGSSKEKSIYIISQQFTKPLNQYDLIWTFRTKTSEATHLISSARCKGTGTKLSDSQTILLAKDSPISYSASSGTFADGDSLSFVSYYNLLNLDRLKTLRKKIYYLKNYWK